MNTVTVDIGGVLHPIPAPAHAVAYTIRAVTPHRKYALIFCTKTTDEADASEALEVARKEFPNQEWRCVVPITSGRRTVGGNPPTKRYTTVPFTMSSTGDAQLDDNIQDQVPGINAMRSFDPGFLDYNNLSSGFAATQEALNRLGLVPEKK
jgi:hypothetical protein